MCITKNAPAQRCLKRRLADHVWRTMVVDERRRALLTAREDNWGGYRIQRGRPNPVGRLFGQVTSRTRHSRAYATTPTSLTNTEAPEGTDLSRWQVDKLEAVALALNNRPLKTLGCKTPSEALNEHLLSVQEADVATPA